MAKKKAVVKKEENLPAIEEEFDFFESDGEGFENVDSETFSIPYLIVLQPLSPQIDEDDPKYVTGAKPGMFLNTVTEELMNEVTLVHCLYNRKMVEWVPRDAGGGFRGAYDTKDPIVSNLVRGEDGKFMLENGNFLADTRYHFVLIIDENGFPNPAVISLTSSQIKKSKDWMYTMSRLKRKHPETGKIGTPAPFTFYCQAKSVKESNDKGTWRGWKFSIGEYFEIGNEKDNAVYKAALEFRKVIKSGAAVVAPPPETTQSNDDDVAF